MTNAQRTAAATLIVVGILVLPQLAGRSADASGFIEWEDVCFPHDMHFEDFGVECESCHHETDAAALATPHPDYFDGAWVDCTTCHRPRGAPATSTTCSSCHHDSPADLADETLSSKVVIHRSCWQCHEVGTGSEASRACDFCHDGKHRHPEPDR